MLRVCQVRSGELESEQSSKHRRASAAFRHGPDELSGRSRGIRGRLRESNSTWLGRGEKSK